MGVRATIDNSGLEYLDLGIEMSGALGNNFEMTGGLGGDADMDGGNYK